MSKFSKVHYEVIANGIAIVQEGISIGTMSNDCAIDEIIAVLQWLFKQDNQKFDEVKFAQACEEVK
jgi:hypothetical protein